jgi:uncharacterized membrane protein YczE
MNDQVRIVLAFQVLRMHKHLLTQEVVQPIVAQTGLDMINAIYGPPNNYFYAIAGITISMNLINNL